MKKVNRPTRSPREIATSGGDFLDPPPSIPVRDIKEAITADVVVIGAGIAGMTAAVSAAEAGATRILKSSLLIGTFTDSKASASVIPSLLEADHQLLKLF
jgi:hypothetical protein